MYMYIFALVIAARAHCRDVLHGGARSADVHHLDRAGVDGGQCEPADHRHQAVRLHAAQKTICLF
ncbi:hypothetical protein BC834DRAFT_914168 [Gloeopeniophorella convolvens]|nr:hypothetical protein BC834DRAFT_914168 [Gloeopeniophorella convolvens]